MRAGFQLLRTGHKPGSQENGKQSQLINYYASAFFVSCTLFPGNAWVSFRYLNIIDTQTIQDRKNTLSHIAGSALQAGILQHSYQVLTFYLNISNFWRLPLSPPSDPGLQVGALGEELVPSISLTYHSREPADRTSEFAFYLKMGMLF